MSEALAPTLEAPRLRLRPWQPADLGAYASIQADPKVRRYLGNGLPLSRREADEHISDFVRLWVSFGHSRWAVEERSTGALLSWCGFLRWSAGTPDEAPELGYGYARATWGQGYATEAARTALSWGFAEFDWTSVVALTHPDNVASQRVLAKLGFLPEGEVDGPYHRMRFFRVSRGGFEATRAASD